MGTENFENENFEEKMKISENSIKTVCVFLKTNGVLNGDWNFWKWKFEEKMEIPANFYQNSLCFSQNQWTFEWGLKNSEMKNFKEKYLKHPDPPEKCSRKSSKMIDLPLHFPMNTFLKISATKNHKKITKKSQFFTKKSEKRVSHPMRCPPLWKPFSRNSAKLQDQHSWPDSLLQPSPSFV